MSKLTEAAERLRRVEATISMSEGVTTAIPHESSEAYELFDALAELMAIPEADDAEPATPEWFENVGFCLQSDGSMRLGELIVYGVFIHPDAMQACWSSGHVFKAAYRTKGQFRRLCAALGIALEETV